MKPFLFLLLCSFVTLSGFAQKERGDRAFSSVHHYNKNVSVKNDDGTRSSIYINGIFATLTNSDGKQSTIEYNGVSFVLNGIDGSFSTVFRNGPSSTIYHPDGTQITINHRPSTSFCTTEYGTQNIMHTFATHYEKCNKNIVDILVHMDWLMQKKAADTIVLYQSEEDS